MSSEFAAAVCEGFCGNPDEVLSRDLPASARNISLRLKKQTESAIEALGERPAEATCSDATAPPQRVPVRSREQMQHQSSDQTLLVKASDRMEGSEQNLRGSVQNFGNAYCFTTACGSMIS
jgi:hypothetical protein